MSIWFASSPSENTWWRGAPATKMPGHRSRKKFPPSNDAPQGHVGGIPYTGPILFLSRKDHSLGPSVDESHSTYCTREMQTEVGPASEIISLRHKRSQVASGIFWSTYFSRVLPGRRVENEELIQIKPWWTKWIHLREVTWPQKDALKVLPDPVRSVSSPMV